MGEANHGTTSPARRANRPASMLVDGDQAELMKRAETIADVYGKDEIPHRLKHVGDPAV